MTESEIIRVLETALLCAQQPMNSAELRKMFVSPEVSADDLRRYLALLQLDWKERGLELVQVAGGWRFQSRPAMQVFLSRLSLERPPKYSRAVLETLAIIAWRQPVTRGDIEDIRGVSVSTQIVRTLEDRGWIEVLGYRDAPGRPALLGTTRQFLNDLGLRSLDELPAVESLDSLDVLAQLPDGGATSDEGSSERTPPDGTSPDGTPSDEPTPGDEQESVSVAAEQESAPGAEMEFEPAVQQEAVAGRASEEALPQAALADVEFDPDSLEPAQADAGRQDAEPSEEIRNSGVKD
ncbi:MAG: SMC-Scp complex subunit ScpB [Alcaligenes sp.]